MDITPVIDKTVNLIDGYNEEAVIINKTHYRNNIILSKKSVWEIPQVQNVLALEPQDLIEAVKEIQELDIADESIFLIGTGQTHQMLPQFQLQKFEIEGFNIDIMSTPAVCRTYNVLIREDREVYAVLMI